MLGRIALRMAVVEALKGKTLVGANVLDSEIGVLSTDDQGNVTSGQSAPFIAVYTDAGEITGDGVRGLLGGGSCDLVIETGLTATMIERLDNGESEIVSGVPATDAGFEVTLDLIARQIADALLDATSPWSILFQCLVLRIRKVVRQRVGHHQHGPRLAAQEIRITLDLVEDPERGIVLHEEGAFGRWLALLPQEDELPAVGALAKIQGAIREYLVVLQQGDAAAWELARQRLGASVMEMGALGLAPLAQDDVGSTIEFESASVESEPL